MGGRLSLGRKGYITATTSQNGSRGEYSARFLFVSLFIYFLLFYFANCQLARECFVSDSRHQAKSGPNSVATSERLFCRLERWLDCQWDDMHGAALGTPNSRTALRWCHQTRDVKRAFFWDLRVCVFSAATLKPRQAAIIFVSGNNSILKASNCEQKTRTTKSAGVHLKQ